MDLSVWEDFVDVSFAEGDRTAFVDALVELLTPAAPLLNFLLVSEDLEMFDGALSFSGQAGYAHGFIPLLEAFGIENIMSPAALEAAVAADASAVIGAVLNPLLDLVDNMMADPLGELMRTLPNLVYFAYSGGLDVAVNNLLHAVNVLFDVIRPVYSTNLFELLGLDFGLTFEGLDGLGSALTGIVNEMLGSQFVLRGATLQHLLAGEVSQFTSANGEIAYRLDLTDEADLLTGFMRFVIDFIFQDNLAEILHLASNALGMNSDIFRQTDAVLNALYQVFTLGQGADMVMFTLLNSFRTLGAFSALTQSLLDGFNNNWVRVLDALQGSDIGIIRDFGTNLANFLDANFGNIFDSGGLASSGLVPFFSAIWAWIQRIFNWVLSPFRAVFA